MKRCNRCKTMRPYTEFHRSNKGPDYLDYRCKACKTELSKTPSYKATYKRYTEENREKVAAVHRAAHQRRYASAEYRTTMADYGRKYRAEHPEVRQASERRRREWRRTAALSDFKRSQWEKIKAAFGYRCAYCGIRSERLTTDHVVPLSHHGDHTARNIVPSCRSCNCRKADKTIVLPMAVIPTYHGW